MTHDDVAMEMIGVGDKLFKEGHWGFYHELGHLIHQSGFSKSQAYKIEDLYLNAKKLNLFLDDYAAVNEQEYFAVGIEAYLSETKKDKSWQYYKHEKRDLVEKDPDLFHFIEEAISYGKQ